MWPAVKQVNGKSSTGECIKACVIGPIIRSQGSSVVHALSSGVIFHDGEIGSVALVYWCRRTSVNKSMRKSSVVTVTVLEGVHRVALITASIHSILIVAFSSALYKHRQPHFLVLWLHGVVPVCVSDDVCLKNMLKRVAL